MGILGELQYKREVFRHGGVEILRMETVAPKAAVAGEPQDCAAEKTAVHGAQKRQKQRGESTTSAKEARKTPAARQVCAVVCALEEFVRKTVAPEAAQMLDTAIAAGRGYAFARYVCRITCKETPRQGKAELLVHFLITFRGQTRHEATLSSLWEADGSLQYRRNA